MIISKDAERVFDKSQHLFMIETLHKLRTQGNLLNLVKNFYSIAKKNEKKHRRQWKINLEKTYLWTLSQNMQRPTPWGDGDEDATVQFPSIQWSQKPCSGQSQQKPCSGQSQQQFLILPFILLFHKMAPFPLVTFTLASYCSLCSNGSHVWLHGVFVCRSSMCVQWILRISKETEEHGFLCTI